MGDDGIQQLAELIRGAERVLVFTGAGISTRSGIPDYRGPQGVWKTEKPVYYQDFLDSDEARRRYWDQKARAWAVRRDAKPNAAHEALVDLERSGRLWLLVTQNIDGLHAAAGTDPARLVEIHGSDARVTCLRCGKGGAAGPHYDAITAGGDPPRCGCGGWMKPATISFGQMLVEEDLALAFDAAEAADLVLALGSTLSVTPAAHIPMNAALQGAPLAIVNQGETAFDSSRIVTLRLDADVTEVLPAAMAAALA